MNDNLNSLAVAAAPQRKSRTWLLAAFAAVGVICVATGVVIAPDIMPTKATVSVAGTSEATTARIDALESRLHALEQRVDVVNLTANVPAHDAPAASAPNPDLSHDLAHVQSDVVGLSAAMTALQTEVKATGATADQARATSASLVAAAVSFMQLRDSAMAGQAYGDDLANLRVIEKNDADVIAALAKLEPYAAGGAPTLAALREELIQREPSVAVAVAKGAAQNWWDRILAALRGLVSVRPLHGGEADALADLEQATTVNATVALDAYTHIPGDAQKNLGDWQKKLAARQQVDEALRDIAQHFTHVGEVKNP